MIFIIIFLLHINQVCSQSESSPNSMLKSTTSLPGDNSTPAGSPAMTSSGETGEAPAMTSSGETGETPAMTSSGETGETSAMTSSGKTSESPVMTISDKISYSPEMTSSGKTSESPVMTISDKISNSPEMTSTDKTNDSSTTASLVTPETTSTDINNSNTAGSETSNLYSIITITSDSSTASDTTAASTDHSTNTSTCGPDEFVFANTCIKYSANGSVLITAFILSILSFVGVTVSTHYFSEEKLNLNSKAKLFHIVRELHRICCSFAIICHQTKKFCRLNPVVHRKE